MEGTTQNVIALLSEYWRNSVIADARTKNNCRLLANAVLGKLSGEAIERITRYPEDHAGELATILDQLSRTDPTSRELIRVLGTSTNHTVSKAQSVRITGNNDQVITAGGDIIGGSIIQNNTVRRQKTDIADPSTVEAPLQNQRQLTGNYQKAVFVSYAWGGESERTVDELEHAFAKRGISIVRDKKDLGYKGSIELFEQRIGQGECIILVISDKYLRSEHCMYELVEVDKNHSLRKRVFPIVLVDARIYKAIDRLTYIQYWDEQISQLNRAIKDIETMTNLAGITADLDKYARIRSNFDQITDILSDMNALTPEMHAVTGYSALVTEVERAMSGKE